jgi:hypothetical protein
MYYWNCVGAKDGIESVMSHKMLIIKARIDFSSTRRALQHLLSSYRKRVCTLLSIPPPPPPAENPYHDGIDFLQIIDSGLNRVKKTIGNCIWGVGLAMDQISIKAHNSKCRLYWC